MNLVSCQNTRVELNDGSLTPIEQVIGNINGVNKLDSMRRCSLCTRSTRLDEFDSTSSLKQQSACRNVALLISFIWSQPVFTLSLNADCNKCQIC